MKIRWRKWTTIAALSIVVPPVATLAVLPHRVCTLAEEAQIQRIMAERRASLVHLKNPLTVPVTTALPWCLDEPLTWVNLQKGESALVSVWIGTSIITWCILTVCLWPLGEFIARRIRFARELLAIARGVS